MPKRDYIAEIRERRSRAVKGAGRFNLFNDRWDALSEAFEFVRDNKRGSHLARRELLRHIPVGSVALIEAYTREVIRDLLKKGLPFTANARSLQEIRLDLGLVLDMGPADVTAGELVAHLLPISSLEDINRHLSGILGTDFIADLKTMKRGPRGEELLVIADVLIPKIQRLFGTRHVICHEMGKKVVISMKNAEDTLGATLVFVDAFEALVRKHLGQKALPL